MHARSLDDMLHICACMLSTFSLSGLMYIVYVLQDVCLVSTALGQLEKHQIHLALACNICPPPESAALLRHILYTADGLLREVCT